MTFQPNQFGRRQAARPPVAPSEAPAAAAAPDPATPPVAQQQGLSEAWQRFHAGEEALRAGQEEGSGASTLAYEIKGGDLQFLEIELARGEGVVAEAGAMIWKDFDIEVESVLGSGAEEGEGFLSKLGQAGKRVLTGESLFMTRFTNMGAGGKARVAFSAPGPGMIQPVFLPDLGGALVCQKDSFLAAARGTKFGIHFQKRIMTGLFGGEGFIMQRLEGQGWAFIHMGGAIVERELGRGERIHVDTGCVAAFTPDVDFNLVSVGTLKNQMFGGEGVFFAALTGPGRVWIQSMPFARLAGRVLDFARPGKGENAGEGSVLGGWLQGGR